MTPLTNPYPGIQPGNPLCIRFNVNALKTDVDTIRIVSGLTPGFITNAMQLLIQHIAAKCAAEGWDMSNTKQLHAYVIELLTTNPANRTTTVVPTKKPVGPVRRRTRSVGATPTVNPHEHATVSGDETETSDGRNKAA
jgi:hypothetical protein